MTIQFPEMRNLGHLGEAFVTLINVSDAEYLADPRRPEVVRRSRIALDTLRLTP